MPVMMLPSPLGISLLCSAAYGAFAGGVVGQARRSPTGIWLASAAFVTAIWAGTAALTPSHQPIAAFDLLRLFAWYGFCLHLYSRVAGGLRACKLFILLGAVGGLGALAAVLTGTADLAGPLDLASPAILLRLGLGIGQLLLLENTYLETDPGRRWHVVLACIALGGPAAYDVAVCADAVLLRAASPLLVTGRPMVAILVMPLLAVAAARNRHWRVDLHVSRTVAFHSATLVISGVFLVALAVIGELVRRFVPAYGGGWGSLTELFLICAGVLTVAVLLTSGSARGLLRHSVVDHFFTTRYDYRREWQRCTEILSAPEPLHERVIRAIADTVDSPAGLFFRREPGQAGLAWAGAWNAPPCGPLGADEAAPLLTDKPCLVPALPLAFAEDPGAPQAGPHLFRPWLAVPIPEPAAGTADLAAPMGCVVLARPRAPFALDAEVFDLLRILASEAAIHLAQDRAAASLLRAQELRAYGERFAFVAHDIKNVASQLSLLLTNAETHLADPAFQQDMLATVRASVNRIGGLIRRLEPARDDRSTRRAMAAPADAGRVLNALLAARARSGAQLTADIPPAGQVAIAMEPAAFQTAVTHLLDNAEQAAGQGGTVRVTLSATADRVAVDIADDGPGMDPVFVRDELFRPFSTRTEGGSGLGAFQARTLVQAAGGELAVLTSPGCGTTMRLFVPRAPGGPAPSLSLAAAEV